MDIVAHAMWAGAGAVALRRRAVIGRRTSVGIVALAVLPDLVPMLPVAAHALGGPDALGFLAAYASATPTTEPALPPAVAAWTHHLHCAAHSVLVVAAATALAAAWGIGRAFLLLGGWWSHVLIDIPTHASDYYAARPFYPLSDFAVDGIAWTDPAMLAANYAALLVVYAWMLLPRRAIVERPPRPRTEP
jgi:hypothetical protein